MKHLKSPMCSTTFSKKTIASLEDQNKKLEKEVAYWKLSFNKQVEALQEPKTCETCKHKYIVSYDCTECRANDCPIDFLDLDCFPDFSCNQYEPKDTK